jgi:uncharacterized membrane protein YphA (DoxX/SURF4 family)
VGTRFFLVTLRLAIGWHILFEGLDKFYSPTWSSEAYLREAVGPLAPTFRDLAGDGLLARLTPAPGNSFPEALDHDWQTYFDKFQRHYPLSEEQSAQTKTVFDQARSKTKTWLLSSTERVKLSSPLPPPVQVDKTVAARIKDLQHYEQTARTIEEEDLPVFGSVVHAKLLEAKKEANSIRASLKADLAKQTAEMRRALREKLTPEQKEMPLPAETVSWPVSEWGQLEWANALVMYGLLVVGLCLLAGVLTRTACLAGALFLLMFYLAMPSLPDWPASPRLEGHYLYINKTFIEMLALLTLATTRSGRWFGLDALLQFLHPGALRTASPGGHSFSEDVPERVVPVAKTQSSVSPARAGLNK